MTLCVVNTIHIYTCLILSTDGGDTGPIQTLIVTSPSCYKNTLLDKALTLSMANINHVFEHLNICVHFTSSAQYLVGHDHVIMGLAINDNHIIYFHVDAQCPIGLTWTYFTSPDYLVVQCWVHATSFHPDMINPTEPNIYCYT